MTSRHFGLICGLLGLLVVFYPEKTEVKPDPVVRDEVSKAFSIYEIIWRQHALTTADKIANRELKTEKEIWDYLANGQVAARKVAFEAIAKAEQDYFTKQGGWNLKAHETLLRSYVK